MDQAQLRLMNIPWQEAVRIELPYEPTSTYKKIGKKQDPLLSCDLTALMTKTEWADVIVTGSNPEEKVALHKCLLEGREDEIGQSILNGELDYETIKKSCHSAYGGSSRDERSKVREWLLRLAENETIVPRGVLALRSEYFAAALRRSQSTNPLIALLEDIPPNMHLAFRRYSYTLAAAELKVVSDWAFETEQGDNEAPVAISVLYAADKVGLFELKDAILNGLKDRVDTENAASLWRVADAVNASKLRDTCVALLARPGVLEEIQALDTNLFLEIISESDRTELEALAYVTKSNPVARLPKFSHLSETISMLRDTLEQKLERSAAAENRQHLADAERRRLHNLGPDPAVWTRIERARREADTLRRYVEAAEARFFKYKSSHHNPHSEPRKTTTTPKEDIFFSYSWQTIPDELSVPAGLELRLTFGGEKKARIPPNWQLRLSVPGHSDTFRRFVDCDTCVHHVLQDVQHKYRDELFSLLDDDRPLDLERSFDKDLWYRRDRLRLICI